MSTRSASSPARDSERGAGKPDDPQTGIPSYQLTLLNVRHTLEQGGRLTLTLPPEQLEADALKPILAAA
jgi:hypothetical protein